ncbi:PAS domain S-box protein [Halorientalis pallida]|uniref:sensor histidine kinase n=1 Tax=Halorientalis pallida TaxID=2479928 RepID=UPI003C6FD781
MAMSLRVLAVDDDPDFCETLSDALQREGDQFTVVTATRASDALDRFDDESFDCIVSDYEMPDMDGLDFLETVRDRDEQLPFILLTGSGSESLASRALSRGVTDYLPKSGSREQFKILANRIETAVDSYRTRELLERERERYRAFLEQSTDLIAVVDATGEFQYVSRAWKRHMGYDPDDLEGRNAFDLMDDDHADAVWSEFVEAVTNPEQTRTAVFKFRHADGGWRWLEAVGNNQFHNPRIEGFVVNVRDVTGRKERERKLKQQNERLEQFASVVSHDLRNPLNVLSGRLELAAETGDEDHFEVAQDTLDRMEAMIDDLLGLARDGQFVEETEPVALAPLLARCRESVDAERFSLAVETDATVVADPSRLRRLFENLVRNSVEHGDPSVTVRVGSLPDGFYVEDDGPGIPPGDQERVFEIGYTTATEGTGLGLAIVESIAEAHGWSVRVTDAAASGGTRFEVTGVELVRSSEVRRCR